MTVSATPVEPAYRACPPFDRTLGPEVADLSALAGFGPDPEQRLALDLLFALDDRGKAAAFEFAVVCARQNLKTGLLKMAALGWLFLTGEQLVVWSAHEFSTAQEAFRDIVALIDGADFLARRVAKVRTANGDEGIELKSSQRLIFKARTNSGGRGLTGDKVILDEAFALRPDHMATLLPTLSVRPDPQVAYASSAPLRGSDVLRSIQVRGRAGGNERLAYVEWCARDVRCRADGCDHVPGTDGCGYDDVDNLRAANPLLGRTRANGTGLTLDYIRAERAALSTPEMVAQWARERLGISDFGTSVDVLPGWDMCVDEIPDGLPLDGLAVSVTRDSDFAAIVAASAAGGRMYVKPLQHGPGVGWVVDRLKQLTAKHDVPAVIDSADQAAVLVPTLERENVPVRLMKTADVLDACAEFDVAVKDRRLRHGRFPELDSAIQSATKRDVRGRWAWGQLSRDADTSTLKAATFAAWAAGNPGETAVSAYESGAVMTV